MKTQTYNQSKDLKAIAAEISRQAASGQYYRYNDFGIARAKFRVGTLTLRCDDTPAAIGQLAARYAKGASALLAHSGTLAQMRARDRGAWPQTLSALWAEIEAEQAEHQAVA